MSLKDLLRLLFIVVLFVGFARDIGAQDGITYSVTGTETVNGRECPRLNCAVVRRLEPNTTINVVATVSGDTVFGSDQWVQANADGEVMYVHSALVAPPDAEALASVPENSPSHFVEMDTSDWISLDVDDFQILVPESWTDITVLLADQDYMDWIQQHFGDNTVEWFHDTYQAIQDNYLDSVLMEAGGTTTFTVSHERMGRVSVAPRRIQRDIEVELLDFESTELVSSELIVVPAGEAVRIEATTRYATGGFDRRLIYAVICDGDVHYLTLMFEDEGYRDEYASIAYTIANSFTHNNSNL